jgi:hypothetical protein
MKIDLSILNWLTVLLVCLNYFDFISISWWAVFIPTYIWMFLLLMAMLMLVVLIAAGVVTTEHLKKINK